MSTSPEKTAPLSRLGLASALGVLSHLLALAVGLWATPRILAGLGDAAYGVLALVVSFATYFVYLELGLGAAYMRELSAALARRDMARAQRLLETAHALYLRIGAFGSGGMLILGFFYLRGVIDDDALRYDAWAGLLLTVLHFAASMAFSASRGIVFSAQRTDLFTRITVILQPLIPFLQVGAIGLGGGLFWVLLIQVAGGIVADLIMWGFARRLAPELIVRARLHREVWREMRGFSLYKFISQMSLQGQLTGDRLLLGALLPIAQVTPYALAASIGQRIRPIVGALNAPFFPAASERFAREGAAGLAALLAPFGRRVAVLLALSNAGAAFLAAPFLTAWVGASYAEEGALVLVLLVISTSLITLSTLAGQSTDAAGRPRAFALATVAGLLFSVVAAVPLVWWLGPEGAALAFLGGAGVQFFWSASALAGVIGKARTLSLGAICLVRPAVVGGVSYAVMRLCPHGASLLARLPAAVAGGIAGVLVGFLVGALRSEDLPRRLRTLLAPARETEAAGKGAPAPSATTESTKEPGGVITPDEIAR